jgi:hypothetical protein
MSRVKAIASVLRSGYVAAVALAIAVVVCLAVGSPAKAALAGAGFAFLGAALTRGVDVARERRTAAAKAEEDRRPDLDETRRLVHAMLSKRLSERDPVLVGTVLNALVHHGLSVDFRIAMPHLTLIDNGEDNDWLAAHWLAEHG